MKKDIEIAQSVTPKRIADLLREKFSIDDKYLEYYGHFKAKLLHDYLDVIKDNPDGKLILVTAMSPTPAGEGKTTTTVGLGDALNKINRKTMIALREPSLGPCFGIKGGAAGGGWAQVIPMEDINLHFTGDFQAVALAHNLLSAMLDNHIFHGNTLNIDVRRIVWRRVVDMNDRALRNMVVGLGGLSNGVPREDGFDIVVASEVMAILCLADSMHDLKQRLGKIVVAYTHNKKPVLARDLNAHGAMATLLKDAIKPNFVQTLEGNIAFIHGGPFANIAHGCNTITATKAALKLADYVVTEAGFGADLGAEKFLDIKCRKADIHPDAVVIVATIRAIKFHGGLSGDALNNEDFNAIDKGITNLKRHVNNIRSVFGLPCVVAINKFSFDTDAEIQLLRDHIEPMGVKVVLAEHWAKGGEGAVDLANEVVRLIDAPENNNYKPLYQDNLPLWDKINSVVRNIYGGSEAIADKKVRGEISRLQKNGYGNFPVCMAKTQYSFSTDPKLLGAPDNHVVPIKEVRLSAGAGFIVVICGEIMTMPGLPKVPAAEHITISDDGKISGLF